jgi:hypothetical protein
LLVLRAEMFRGHRAPAAALILAKDDRRIAISGKALLMLKHMRKQIEGQPARDVEGRSAAISAGVAPVESECASLVEDLLRGGYLQRYPSPRLTAHGLYRLTDSGIAAAEKANSPSPLRGAPKSRRPGSS